MRGKVQQLSDRFRFLGITPAYAGKSLAEFGKTSKAWDHPRLCGEKYTRSLPYLVQRGSPPPMRGKVANDPDIPPEVGINVINLKRPLNGKQNVWKYQNGEEKSDSDGREKDV